MFGNSSAALYFNLLNNNAMKDIMEYLAWGFILFCYLGWIPRLERKVKHLEEQKIKNNNHIFGLEQRLQETQRELKGIVDAHNKLCGVSDHNMKIVHEQLVKMTDGINEMIGRVNEIHEKTFITIKNN